MEEEVLAALVQTKTRPAPLHMSQVSSSKMNKPIWVPDPPHFRHRTPPIRGSPGLTTIVFGFRGTYGVREVTPITFGATGRVAGVCKRRRGRW